MASDGESGTAERNLDGDAAGPDRVRALGQIGEDLFLELLQIVFERVFQVARLVGMKRHDVKDIERRAEPYRQLDRLSHGMIGHFRKIGR